MVMNIYNIIANKGSFIKDDTSDPSFESMQLTITCTCMFCITF